MSFDFQTMTISSFAGFATGFTCVKVGKIGLLVAGTGFMAIQGLNYLEYITPNWDKIDSDFSRIDVPFLYDDATKILTNNMPSVTAFAGGFLYGIKVAK